MPPFTETSEGRDRVTILEVGPRDGLQNEKRVIPTEDKLKLIALLADCGFSRIEATAFVSPKWVPQMADHAEVMRRASRGQGARLSALAPNEQGAIAAIAAGFDTKSLSSPARPRRFHCAIRIAALKRASADLFPFCGARPRRACQFAATSHAPSNALMRGKSRLSKSRKSSRVCVTSAAGRSHCPTPSAGRRRNASRKWSKPR